MRPLLGAFHGKTRFQVSAMEFLRAFLPPARDDGLAHARAWRERREREDQIAERYTCSMCAHFARHQMTMPLLPHTFRGEVHG